MSQPWNTRVRLHELARGALSVRLEPDAAQRAKLAYDLGLESLPALTVQLAVKPWFDGAEITGGFDAVVEQICAVSLEAFEHPLAGPDRTYGSCPPTARMRPSRMGESSKYDPDAPDPPDVLESDIIDLAAYVVEQLTLEIDPFARKPGATFDYTPPDEPESPFAVLKKLKRDEP